MYAHKLTVVVEVVVVIVVDDKCFVNEFAKVLHYLWMLMAAVQLYGACQNVRAFRDWSPIYIG